MSGGPHDLLPTLRGWERASVSRLEGGLSNRAWKLEVDDRSAVLKLDHAGRSGPAISRAEEARAQERAARHGLAAPVLWHSPAGILTTWLEGDPLSSASLEDAALVAATGQALCRLHALPLSGHEFDLAAWAGHYRGELEAAGRFDAEARRHWKHLVTVNPPGLRAFSHNDAVPANLVLGESGIRFIDWEYAGDNSPWFDLAVVVVEAGLDQERRDILLDAYLGGRPPLAGSLDDYISIYRALVALWSAVRLPVVP